MKIRKAIPADIDLAMALYAGARERMQKSGNGNQWINGYPSREQIMRDITGGNSYLCTDDQGHDVVGVFFYSEEVEPTYAQIYEGNWLNDRPYGVVHRLAGREGVRGIGRLCLTWCFEQCGNLRADTHHDNLIMQALFRNNGFSPCGIIYVSNGTSRLAFQRVGE